MNINFNTPKSDTKDLLNTYITLQKWRIKDFLMIQDTNKTLKMPPKIPLLFFILTLMHLCILLAYALFYYIVL